MKKRLFALSPVLLGSFWMLLAALSFVALSVSVRALSADLGSVEILFFRCAIGVVLFVPWIARGGIRVLRTSKFGHHLLRAVLMGVGMVFWFAAIAVLPLGDAIALHFTLPLFLIIFAALILREKVDAPRWIATVTGFAGVFVILRPGLEAVSIAMIYVLISAALYAANHTMTKMMSGTESANATAFYMNFLILPGAALALPFYWTLPELRHVGWILMLGLAGSSAHVCLMRAMACAEASVLAPVDFLRLPAAALAAYFLFGDVSDRWTWLGAGVIFLAAWYNTWWASRLEAAAGK
jgi:drug/metabolite transporter (DMT)-like permease